MGVYSDVLYGEAIVTLQEGVLRISVGPAFAGRLEHWHLDTFRARWDDQQLGRAWVEFQLDRRGDVKAVEVEGWRAFQKVEEKG